jgi:hypothetical protein
MPSFQLIDHPDFKWKEKLEFDTSSSPVEIGRFNWTDNNPKISRVHYKFTWSAAQGSLLSPL